MAGFCGWLSKNKARSFPNEKYFIDPGRGGTATGFEHADFRLIHFRLSDGESKCGKDASGKLMAGYAGYIENIESLFLKYVNGVEFSKAIALSELYKELGDRLWDKLNGNYAAFVYEHIPNRIHLTSDRFCSIPIYYTVNSDGFFFSTSLLALASIFDDTPELDLQATTDFLLFGYPLNERTLIKGFQMISDGCFVRFDNNGGVITQRYWEPNFRAGQNITSCEEAVENMFFAIKGAIARYCKGDNIGLAMSGGLDSRYIAAQIPERINYAVVNGNPHSYEVRGAMQVCESLDIPWWNLFYDIEQFESTLQDAIIANDGIHNTPEFFLVSQLLADRNCSVGIFGAYGNGIRGQMGPDLVWKYEDLHSARTGLCDSANREYIGFQEAPKAFGDLPNRELIDQAKQTFCKSFDRIASDEPINVCLFQDIYYRNRRRIFPAFGVSRRFLELRYPFTDNELVDLTYSIPAKLRIKCDIYRSAFISQHPELASIPNQFGYNYFYEAKYSWLRQIKRKVYYASPNFFRYLVRSSLPEHPNPANRDVYHTALKQETTQRLTSLSHCGILDEAFVDKLLKEQFSGYVNRYTLIHKLFTLSCLIDGFGIWRGLQIKEA